MVDVHLLEQARRGPHQEAVPSKEGVPSVATGEAHVRGITLEKTRALTERVTKRSRTTDERVGHFYLDSSLHGCGCPDTEGSPVARATFVDTSVALVAFCRHEAVSQPAARVRGGSALNTGLCASIWRVECRMEPSTSSPSLMVTMTLSSELAALAAEMYSFSPGITHTTEAGTRMLDDVAGVGTGRMKFALCDGLWR